MFTDNELNVIFCFSISISVLSLHSHCILTVHGRNPSETSDQWEMQYARSTAQEIYDKTVDRSKFFKEYIGYNFMEAAFLAHRK